MRGKDDIIHIYIWVFRITPAHAGKSRYHGVWAFGPEDHPRACGEKKVAHPFKFGLLGSPPRMRGKGFALKKSRRGLGITPAHAGKSAETNHQQ